VKASSLGRHLICVSDAETVALDSLQDGEGLAEKGLVPLALVRQAIGNLATPAAGDKRLEIQSACRAMQCAEGTMCFFGVGCADISLAQGVDVGIYDGWNFRPDGFFLSMSSTN
jgi:hypothetical protein